MTQTKNKGIGKYVKDITTYALLLALTTSPGCSKLEKKINSHSLDPEPKVDTEHRTRAQEKLDSGTYFLLPNGYLLRIEEPKYKGPKQETEHAPDTHTSCLEQGVEKVAEQSTEHRNETQSKKTSHVYKKDFDCEQYNIEGLCEMLEEERSFIQEYVPQVIDAIESGEYDQGYRAQEPAEEPKESKPKTKKKKKCRLKNLKSKKTPDKAKETSEAVNSAMAQAMRDQGHIEIKNAEQYDQLNKGSFYQVFAKVTPYENDLIINYRIHENGVIEQTGSINISGSTLNRDGQRQIADSFSTDVSQVLADYNNKQLRAEAIATIKAQRND
ncbi:hypothetical protein ACFL96_18645 [Thermoproteota archaeon]